MVQTPNDTAVIWEYDHPELHSNVLILDSLDEQGAVAMENLFSSGIDYDSSNQNYAQAFVETFSNYRDTFRWHYGYNSVKPSYQISPRIGIAYPITDQGVIHVSYGHFFQIPNYSFLYANPEFEILNNNNGGILGNAALLPEKTVMYEIGFKPVSYTHLTLPTKA